MQATSTPTLAQPKYGASAALGAAAILAVGLAVGALVVMRPVTSTVPATDATTTGIEQGLAAKNAAPGAAIAGPTSADSIESGLAAKNGTAATNPAKVLVTTPTGTQVFTIGGRDPMAHFNSIGLAKAVSDHDLIRGSRGWYAYPPVDNQISSYDELRNRAGWYAFPPATELRPMIDDLYLPSVQDPTTNLQDYFGPRIGWDDRAAGNDTPVGRSHR